MHRLFRFVQLCLCLLALGLTGVLIACASESKPAPASVAPTSLPAAAAPTAVPTSAPVSLKVLKVDPVKGHIGDRFTITAEGLTPNKEAELAWATVDGSFSTKVYPETVEFYERSFAEKRMSLGRSITDAQGRLNVTLSVPDDYGEVHDIYAVLEGKDVARGGYRILPEFTMTPLDGPIGTPITIQAQGIGWKNWESTWGVDYDNKYTGFVSAVTTRGKVVAVIRAAGPVGKHTIDVWHAGQTVPYLNWEQSPQAHIPIFQFTFNVTKDAGAPPLTLDWPDGGAENVDGSVARTTATAKVVSASTGSSASLSPFKGPILSKATARVTKLPANTEIEMFWVTARGSRTSGLGWGLAESLLGKAMTDKDGVLVADFQVPDDLGGWHTIKFVNKDTLLAEAAYLVQPSLATITPTRLKVGESFKVNIKGVGWTELDNIYTIDYDNAYIGFACGFNSNGDVTVNLRASGVPGTHLIDLYPAIYQGHGKPPWLYDTPQLTWSRDHPSLVLGYHLPAFRLAIEVIE